MKIDDNIIFCWRCLRTMRYTKGQFPKDGVRRVSPYQKFIFSFFSEVRAVIIVADR